MTEGIGHNSGVTTYVKDKLKGFVERVENLEAEKKTYADDIRDVYKEAKGQGFDVKTMRQVVRLRKKNAAERADEAAMLDLYLDALGLL